MENREAPKEKQLGEFLFNKFQKGESTEEKTKAKNQENEAINLNQASNANGQNVARAFDMINKLKQKKEERKRHTVGTRGTRSVFEYLKMRGHCKDIVSKKPLSSKEVAKVKSSNLTDKKKRTVDAKKKSLSLRREPKPQESGTGRAEERRPQSRLEQRAQNAQREHLQLLFDKIKKSVADNSPVNSYKTGYYRKLKSRNIKKKTGLSRLAVVFRVMSDVESSVLKSQELGKNQMVLEVCQSFKKYLKLKLRKLVEDKKDEMMAQKTEKDLGNQSNQKAIEHSLLMNRQISKIMENCSQLMHDKKFGAMSETNKFHKLVQVTGQRSREYKYEPREDSSLKLRHSMQIRDLRKKYKDFFKYFEGYTEDIIDMEFHLENARSKNTQVSQKIPQIMKMFDAESRGTSLHLMDKLMRLERKQ